MENMENEETAAGRGGKKKQKKKTRQQGKKKKKKKRKEKRGDRNRPGKETEGGYMCERLCVLGLDHNLEARC